MGLNRKQLSLIVTDDTLYSELVVPKSQSKELNDIILRCLSAYYYKEDVRKLIDGVDESSSQGEDFKKPQTIINDIRSALAMQTYYADELDNTLKDGIDDVSSILSQANAKAEEDGLVKTEQSSFGNTQPRIMMKTSAKDDESADFSKLQEDMLNNAKKGNYTSAFESVAKSQKEMMSMLELILHSINNDESFSEEMIKDLDKTLSNMHSSQAHTTENDKNDFKSDTSEDVVNKSDTNVGLEKENVAEQTTPEPEPIKGDDALAELLGSLH